MTHTDDLRDDDITECHIGMAESQARFAIKEAEKAQEIGEKLDARITRLEQIVANIGSKYIDSFSDLDKARFYTIAGDYKNAKKYATIEFERLSNEGKHKEAISFGKEYILSDDTLEKAVKKEYYTLMQGQKFEEAAEWVYSWDFDMKMGKHEGYEEEGKKFKEFQQLMKDAASEAIKVCKGQGVYWKAESLAVRYGLKEVDERYLYRIKSHNKNK